MTWARRFAAIGGLRRSMRVPSGSSPYLLNYSSGIFTRSSEASAVDPRDGYAFYNLTTPWLGTDVPRLYSDGAVLIEDSRTNVDTDSRDFSTWTGSNATVTTGQADGPDGMTSTADLIEASSDTSPKITKSTGLSSGEVTFGVYLKKATWDGTVTIALTDGSTTQTADLVLSTSWQHVEVTLSSAAAAVTAEIRFSADSSADCYVDLSDMVAVASPHSTIRTSGTSATRASENLYVPNASVDARLFSGHWQVHVWSPWDANGSHEVSPRILNCADTTSDRLRFVGNGGGIRLSNAGNNENITGLSYVAGDKVTIDVDFPGSTLTVYINDVYANDVPITADWSGQSSADIYVGSSGLSSGYGDLVISRPEIV